MHPGFGLPGSSSNQMGNCVSSQSQAGALEKQAAGSRGRGLVAMRKAAMEKYPVPNKYLVGSAEPEVAQLRSRLRPPSVRPLSIQLNSSKQTLNGSTSTVNGAPIDTNGNIPRPSSLPRLIVNKPEANVAAKIESLLGKTPSPVNRTVINPPPVGSSSSPSPSNRSVASSLDSNRDSGIITSSSTHSAASSISEHHRPTTLNKFGFQGIIRKPLGAVESLKNNINNSKPQQPSAKRTAPARIPSAPVRRIQPTVVPKVAPPVSSTLDSVKSRAAKVLNRVKPVENRPIAESKPRLSVEAIVASLEQEIRSQIGPEHPLPPKEEEKPVPVTTFDVERFLAEPTNKAEITFLESESSTTDGDFIEDIELHLNTPSSSEGQTSPRDSPDDGTKSRDEGHPDEEDSAATSISDDAMIDDEIADQPGLLMLGQSASVPASPMMSRSWRSDLSGYGDLFAYSLPEEEPDSTASSRRRVRRRVASVSDIEDSLKKEVHQGSPSAGASAMRADLLGWSSTTSGGSIVIDLEDYTVMADELADIRAQLITLQNLLMESEDGVTPDGTAPLWDLKRDLVLLREELQEKNTTIRTLKSELKAVGGRSSIPRSKETLTRSASCNVATQTDRSRTTLSNGASPTDSSEEGHLLVSTKMKLSSSGLPVRSQQPPARLTKTTPVVLTATK